jgi:hypothetical protein
MLGGERERERERERLLSLLRQSKRERWGKGLGNERQREEFKGEVFGRHSQNTHTVTNLYIDRLPSCILSVCQCF